MGPGQLGRPSLFLSLSLSLCVCVCVCMHVCMRCYLLRAVKFRQNVKQCLILNPLCSSATRVFSSLLRVCSHSHASHISIRGLNRGALICSRSLSLIIAQRYQNLCRRVTGQSNTCLLVCLAGVPYFLNGPSLALAAIWAAPCTHSISILYHSLCHTACVSTARIVCISYVCEQGWSCAHGAHTQTQATHTHTNTHTHTHTHT